MRAGRLSTIISLWAVLAVACGGHAVVVSSADQEQAAGATSDISDQPAVHVGAEASEGRPGQGGLPGTASTGRSNCATTSNPDEGFTADTLKIGTILPLTGALRPLGEQVARVMQITVENINRNENIPGPLGHLNWGCPERPGVFGRRVELEIYSLQSSTPEEALAGMRRLIDVEKVFLVRDCYLTASLMGPAVQYQNSKGVPGIWCHFPELPMPALAPWNFAPGIDPQMQSAIHTGYLINALGRERIGILADPTAEDTVVNVVRRIADHFGHPVPDSCVIYKRSQEAPNGMRSEIARLRTCYDGQSPDAVFAADALQAVFGALEAESQGWRGADAGVQWVCTNPSCWVTSLAELCGDACEGMIADCATLPCVPWADPDKYPSVRNFRQTRAESYPGEPEDAVTYGPAAITAGIALYLTMTGPDLSREKFRETLESLRNWSSGIGPYLNTSPENHFGSRAQWLIQFTGRDPWFDDLSGDFITIEDVDIPESLVRG